MILPQNRVLRLYSRSYRDARVAARAARLLSRMALCEAARLRMTRAALLVVAAAMCDQNSRMRAARSDREAFERGKQAIVLLHEARERAEWLELKGE